MVKKLAFLLCLTLAVGLMGATIASGAALDLKITAGTNDAEEHLADGTMDVTSTDLEMPYEDSGTPSSTDPQLACLRYILPLAKGAKINKAYVVFTCDETKDGSKPVNLIVEGQQAANPAAFAATAKNLSGRAPWTLAKVAWTVENWTMAGQTSQTPDLTAILQELTTQDGWASGNTVVLAFRDDPNKPSTGLRCADAYEDQTAGAGTAPVLHVEFFSPEAKNPDPANGAQEVASPLLLWTAGDGAILHQVYVGTTPTLSEADKAGAPTPVAMYFHLTGLTPGATYYWRVDEYAADGTVATGPVWSFTAVHVAAYSPNPADGGVWQRNDTTISWKAGSGAISHKVYGGANKAAVVAGDPNVVLGIQAEASFALGKLTPLTVYYWRVDEVDAQGAAIPGPVWSINVVGANTGSWRTAAAAAGPGYLATYVADSLYDIGAFGGEMTYEFIVRGNPDEKEASQCLIGRRDFGDTQMGLKYEQWNNTKTYGATVFGVADYDFKVANAPGEYTHLVFVSSQAAKKTDLYVDGVLQGSVATDITLSGQVGIGYGAQNRPPAAPSFDNFDGNIFGVAIYDKALSAAEIAANSAAFLQGGPEAVTSDLRIAAGADDAEEHLNAGMDITSSDLEIIDEDPGTPATDEQLIGMRWLVPVAKGAAPVKAYIEFQLKEIASTAVNTQPVNVIIEGQLSPNSPAFTTTAKDITDRPRTKAQVEWTIPTGMAVGDKFRTPDISPIINELISQDGWASGNAIVIMIRDDKSSPSTGIRNVYSYNGSAASAPLLHLEVLVPWEQ